MRIADRDKSTARSLASFNNFSPVLRSLHIVSDDDGQLSSHDAFNLIRSFPLLEDLSIRCWGAITGDNQAFPQPSTSPILTGTLELDLHDRGIEYTARQLLGLPDGLYFKKFVCRWCGGGIPWIAALVEACSNTLEYFEIGSPAGTSFQPLL